MSVQVRVRLHFLLMMTLPGVLFLSSQWSDGFTGRLPEAQRCDKVGRAGRSTDHSEVLAASFPSIRPLRRFGRYCWNPAKVSKKMKVMQKVAANDITKGLATAHELPNTIVDPTAIRLPCKFAENLPSQRVFNMFPYRPGLLPALTVARERGLCLKNLDFVLDASSLILLARTQPQKKRYKHLVQKLPGTDVIAIGNCGRYMQELHDIGYQFERLMTGEPQDGLHDVRWHEAIQLLDIGGWQVLVTAEVDALNAKQMPVEIKSSKTIRRRLLILQMLASGAVELVHAKEDRQHLAGRPAAIFQEARSKVAQRMVSRSRGQPCFRAYAAKS